MPANRLTPVVAAIALASAGLVLAQSAPPSATPDSPASVAEEPTPPASDDASPRPAYAEPQSGQPASNPAAARLQTCMARMRAQNAGMSEQQLARACKYSNNPAQ
jgi:hypothetical protein